MRPCVQLSLHVCMHVCAHMLWGLRASFANSCAWYRTRLNSGASHTSRRFWPALPRAHICTCNVHICRNADIDVEVALALGRARRAGSLAVRVLTREQRDHRQEAEEEQRRLREERRLQEERRRLEAEQRERPPHQRATRRGVGGAGPRVPNGTARDAARGARDAARRARGAGVGGGAPCGAVAARVVAGAPRRAIAPTPVVAASAREPPSAPVSRRLRCPWPPPSASQPPRRTSSRAPSPISGCVVLIEALPLAPASFPSLDEAVPRPGRRKGVH